MTVRLGWRWTDTPFSGDQQILDETSDGKFVYYLDYEKLVQAIKDTILDQRIDRLEKVLIELGEMEYE